MKRLLAILLICLFLLGGCSSENDALNEGLQLRNMLLSSKGCSFQAAVTADYVDEVYTFCVDCIVDKDGKLSFCVTAPESVDGISGYISYDQSALTFDGEVLAFPKLTDKELSPVSVPWIFVNTLKSGYLTACGETENGYQLLLNDSYANAAMQLEIHIDRELKPYFCEILWQGHRVLSMNISTFEIL